ncbi:YlxM family DNA-binding protein [Paludifilum halophilum]|uniref:UPF0122 protein CHM34_16300 n=1 Tax=Paludifilum halophilum TaxID=1642702 RepID=A0A235B2E7_9BACL|nr:YlxM family DNA-binding protein [Paludifilum halophilum]OYD06453.1 DNA-binding protein [Paludifilum halophilum]
MLEKTTRINLLYDFYGPLLTERQRTMLELYYHEDWSLGEIADYFGISRQAVFEGIKRARKIMEGMEQELRLFAKHVRRREIVEQIRTEMKGSSDRKAVESLLQELLDLD